MSLYAGGCKAKNTQPIGKRVEKVLLKQVRTVVRLCAVVLSLKKILGRFIGEPVHRKDFVEVGSFKSRSQITYSTRKLVDMFLGMFSSRTQIAHLEKTRHRRRRFWSHSGQYYNEPSYSGSPETMSQRVSLKNFK